MAFKPLYFWLKKLGGPFFSPAFCKCTVITHAGTDPEFYSFSQGGWRGGVSLL
uniref:Uncharacterized protein n=1 Tax=Anguilla anguilla TaxID=7936 RepID=A0A0E9Q2X2_ANGAN